MLRFKYPQVVLQEVPDEISLALSITGCTVGCKDCHSKDTWNPKEGEILNIKALKELLKRYPYITCILFYGGEWDCNSLLSVFRYIKKNTNLSICLYTGKHLNDILNDEVYLGILNQLSYLKTEQYKIDMGNLRECSTNQRMYSIKNGKIEEDITYKFWRT